MRKKYFILIFAFLLVLFLLCSCDKKQEKQKKDSVEKEPETVIYTKIEQEGAVNPVKGSSIYIMHPDFSVFTQEENEAIKAVDGVTNTEYYGGAARTKYCYQLDGDYVLLTGDEVNKVHQYFVASDQEAEEHFIRSSGSIAKEDLQEGRLPEADNEVVLYTSDFSMLGKTMEMYFFNNDLFYQGVNEMDCFIEKDMVICGILKEKTKQMYFSDSFCDMIGKNMTECGLKSSYMVMFETGNYTDGFVRIQDKIGPEGSVELGDARYQETMDWNGEYDFSVYLGSGAEPMLVYIDDTLSTSEVLLSSYYWEFWNNYVKEKHGNESLYSIYDIIDFSYRMPEHWVFSEEETNLGLLGYSECSEVTMSNSDQKPMVQYMLLGIKDFSLKSGSNVMAVSRELFDAMHPYQGSKVIEVYMEVEKEDEVRAKLAEQGYTEYKIQTYERTDKQEESTEGE